MNTRLANHSLIRKTILIAFAAVGSCTLLSGCGSSGDATATAGPTGPVAWSYVSDPAQVKIQGGPWTLTQLAAGNPRVKATAPYLASGTGVNTAWNYCTNGVLNTNTSATPVNMTP